MSNTLGIDFAADVGEFASDLPSTLTFGGSTVTGTAGSITRRDDVAPEGIFNEAELLWIGQTADFAALPTARDVVEVDGVSYHVDAKETFQSTVQLSLRRV